MVVFLSCSVSFADDSANDSSNNSSNSDGLSNAVTTTENSSGNAELTGISSNSFTNSVDSNTSAGSNTSVDSNIRTDSNVNSDSNTSTGSNNNTDSNTSTVNSRSSSSSSTPTTVSTSNSGSNKPTTLSQSSILLASKSVYTYMNKNGKLPNYVTIAGFKYSLSEYMYILSKTITYKYNKITSSIKVKYDVKNPSKASGNSIKGTISSKSYYTYAKNIVNYIEKYNRAPNYINSGLGKIQYQTAIFGLNKVLNYIYSNGKLPSTLSLNVKASHSMNKYLPVYNRDSSSSAGNSLSSSSSNEAAGEPTKLSQSAIFTASKTVRDYVTKNGKLPNSVTISGVKFSMPEYMYLVSKAIALKYSKSTSSVTIKWNIKNPTSPSGSTIKKTVSKSIYYDWVKRTYKYIDKNKKAPNYISSKYGKIQYQTAIYGLARVGAYLATYKKIPSTLTLSVAKTSKLNKNMPSFTRTNPTTPTTPTPSTSSYNLTSSKNAIWVHSGDMKKVDLDLLGKYGIGNIFLHENVFNNYAEAVNWIQQAAAKGFKVHIWFTTFYNATSGVWTNPIKDGALNQNYFNSVISRAKSYAAINGVAGIHLDYLRYPGSSTNKASLFTYDNGKNGADAITEFVRQLSVAVKAINKNIILSAALMPEKSAGISYYGQNAPKLGQYLDVLIPMLYEGNYNKDNAWIESTTKWYKENSGGAQVWGGLYGYRSDSDLTRLSVAELTADCKSVLNGGGDGIAIFRWGITNLFNLLGIK